MSVLLHSTYRPPVWLIGVTIAVLATQSGCAPYRWETTADSSRPEPVINPPPSRRGNPPAYEVLGQRYYVLDSSVGYRARGVASWYGKDFHGLSTAGGEIYDMYALTAAHKTLPIPTWVEVTHLRNGKRVIVKVNDRGPFVDDRLIDLSYAAAETLGIVGEGTAMVNVRALGVPAGGSVSNSSVAADGSSGARSGDFALISDAAAAVPGEHDEPLQRIYVQVGAFSERENAARLVSTLKSGGIDEVFVVSEDRGRRALHRVRIGPLNGIHEFDDLLAGLSSLGVNDTQLVVEH